MPRPAPPVISITTALLLLFLLLTCSPHSPAVHAQYYRPKYSTFSTFVEGRGLFIGGGKASGETTIAETFMIDLSTNWTTSSPKYEQLMDGLPVLGSSNTISPDGKLWLTSYSNRFYAYNFEQKMWGTDPYVESSSGDGDIRDFGAVTDIENGLIYVPNAFPNYMMRINTAGPSYDKVAMPPQLNETESLSMAWSAHSQKIFLFGGLGESKTVQSWKVFSYSSTEGWIDLSTSMKGTVPAFRYDACFVPAYDGAKMVFFGGYSDLDVISGDISVLDVATLTWTKGPTAPKRASSACAASGDYFISWSGESDSDSGPVNSTLSYDLKASRWTTTYIAPPPSATRTPRSVPTSSPISPGSPSPNNPDNPVANSPSQVAVIVGGALGGVAVAIVAVGFLLFRVRRKRGQNSIKN
ncbi:MAG: hypothetical protein J3Q66DRAFT_335286, partial [Benniella sp.]